MSDSNPNNGVQLGCGTLIVIALIVMFFSGGRDTDKILKSVNELNAKVDRLEQKIDELSKRADLQPAPGPAGAR
jgi:outer membrane murein-binding lipoprotein Lpp